MDPNAKIIQSSRNADDAPTISRIMSQKSTGEWLDFWVNAYNIFEDTTPLKKKILLKSRGMNSISN